MVKKTAIFIVTSVAIYAGIAAGLVIFGVPGKDVTPRNDMRFDELILDYTGLPSFLKYRTRDDNLLSYRYYPAASDTSLILLHGAGWHSRYLFPLADDISERNLAKVFTPDLRGHGHTPKKRGDISYIGQYEDDLADLISEINEKHHPRTIIVGGHSSGGGLALRFGGSRHGHLANAYLLLAPYLAYNAPTVRENSGGWARPYTGRIIGLSMLNNIGIDWFNYLDAISFNLPKAYRDGTETLTYSYRLNTALAPEDYQHDLETIRQPMKVIVGEEDNAFDAGQYKPTISPLTNADISILPGVSHMGVIVGEDVRTVVADWLKKY